MVNPLHHHLSVSVCADAADAIAQGFNWATAVPAVKPIEIKKVVVVRNGTVEGNSTVDLLLEDDTGQQFVCILTGNLLKAIPA